MTGRSWYKVGPTEVRSMSWRCIRNRRHVALEGQALQQQTQWPRRGAPLPGDEYRSDAISPLELPRVFFFFCSSFGGLFLPPP